MAQRYFGDYERFDTTGKDMGGRLLSADNLVGDEYHIEIELDEEGHRAWLVNRFDQRVGHFSPVFSRKLSVMAAEGMELRAVLAFVAFSTEPEPGHYWGQAAVFAFAPAYEAPFEQFIANVGKQLGEGVRPAVRFDAEAVDRIIDSGGSWMPSKTLPAAKVESGTMIMKDKLSMMDKAVEAGRARKVGCYVVSVLFIIVVVALVIWGISLLF